VGSDSYYIIALKFKAFAVTPMANLEAFVVTPMVNLED